jgi:glycosyltransferase involved in cell wall biosynthesis
MRNILFFTQDPPCYTTSGGRVALSDLIILLHKHHVTYLGPKISEDIKILLENNGYINFKFLSSNSLLPKIFCFLTLQRNHFELHACLFLLKQRIKSIEYEIFFQQYSRSWTALFSFSAFYKNSITILRLHNVEFRYYKINRKFNLLAILHAWFSELISIRICDKLIALSYNDYSEYNSKISKSTEVEWQIPFDFCPYLPNLYAETSTIKPIKFDFLLLANYSAQFNINSLKSFLSINREYIDINNFTLLIAGRSPASAKEKIFFDNLSSNQNINVLFDFKDVAQVYSKCHILIIPDLYCIGLKMRIIESLRFNTPIIATKDSVAGYESLPPNICITLPSNTPKLPDLKSIDFLKSSASANVCVNYWQTHFKPSIYLKQY